MGFPIRLQRRGVRIRDDRRVEAVSGVARERDTTPDPSLPWDVAFGWRSSFFVILSLIQDIARLVTAQYSPTNARHLFSMSRCRRCASRKRIRPLGGRAT